MTHTFTQSFRGGWFRFGFIVIVVLAIGLRFWHLDSLPPNLYWEETALGYDAYSILKTGHDHHGHFLPLIAFESFGDYKPSFYFYSLVPSIALFGLNAFAVRVPSALAGVMIVIGVGVLARQLAARSRWRPSSLNSIQLWTMLVASLSPWAIQFSRAGWEVNLATCLLTWGVVLGFHCISKPKQRVLWLIVSGALFASSMYTYHATRLIAPLLFISVLFVIDQPWKWLKIQNWKISFSEVIKRVLPYLFFLVLISPLLLAIRDPSTQQRFAETSILNESQPVLQSNQYQEWAGQGFLSKLFLHRYDFYAQEFISGYLSHFNLTFLAVSGDVNARHSVQFVGLFYVLDLFFLWFGVVALVRNRNGMWAVVSWWLMIGLVPAALTTATPHQLRILPIMPVAMILLGWGVTIVWSALSRRLKEINFKKRSIPLPSIVITLAIPLAIGLQFVAYWRFYTKIYPVIYGSDWQVGYPQMIEAVTTAMKEHPDLPVFITRDQGRPAMEYWFYTKTDPKLVQVADAAAKKDQGEFLEFQNIHFINSVNEASIGIVAASPEGHQQLLQNKRTTQPLVEIKDLGGKTIWKVFLLTP